MNALFVHLRARWRAGRRSAFLRAMRPRLRVLREERNPGLLKRALADLPHVDARRIEERLARVSVEMRMDDGYEIYESEARFHRACRRAMAAYLWRLRERGLP